MTKRCPLTNMANAHFATLSPARRAITIRSERRAAAAINALREARAAEAALPAWAKL